jgi:hypothetical protein
VWTNRNCGTTPEQNPVNRPEQAAEQFRTCSALCSARNSCSDSDLAQNGTAERRYHAHPPIPPCAGLKSPRAGLECVRAMNVFRVPIPRGSFPAKSAADAHGNSAQYVHSSFPPSGRVLRLARRAGRPPVAPRWALGERVPPGRSGLPLRRPVGHGWPVRRAEHGPKVAVRWRERRATSWHFNNGNCRTRSCRPASEASLGMRMIARQLNGQAATSRR